ncbi:hypothetical protein ACTU3I_02355 [Microbacterium sp. RD1]|uniref:hypothetical protein n=1 Tax=Microbacterium sp. RD1 TaxID=3457313 RepID=UPI003FA5AC43
MLVVMLAMGRVVMGAVNIIDMVVVLDRLVSAVGAVLCSDTVCSAWISVVLINRSYARGVLFEDVGDRIVDDMRDVVVRELVHSFASRA